jgi:excinuclease ABC subunit C
VGAYRRFKIKTVDGANDVASIHEVITRRFKRAADEMGDGGANRDTPPAMGDGGANRDTPPATEEAPADADNSTLNTQHSTLNKWADLPDLVLIDGGRGQLNAALDALRALKFDYIPVVGVAKGVGRDRFDLVRPDQDDLIVLARDSKALGLVQRVDEEAHRFAITYHRKLRSKAAFASPLEEIAGIGPKRKKALLKAFGSLDGIRKATVEELAAVPGMTKKAAEELKGLL